MGNLQVIVNATGTITPTNPVDNSREMSSTLKTALAAYNDHVEKGAVLAALDTEKLQAMLDVLTAAAGAASARFLRADATMQEAAHADRLIWIVDGMQQRDHQTSEGKR